jgi:hypothetical protein
MKISLYTLLYRSSSSTMMSVFLRMIFNKAVANKKEKGI